MSTNLDKKTIKIKNGIITIDKSLFIFQPSEGSFIDSNASENLITIIKKEFKGKDFCCITDSKYSFAFNPHTYIEMLESLSSSTQLRGVTRVIYQDKVKSISFLKEMLPKQLKYDEFDSMENAIKWAKMIISS